MMVSSSSALSDAAIAYIPADWRQAIYHGHELPQDTRGAVLFADISGFTLLTEAMTKALGIKRGVEELPRYLNQVYDGLIVEVDNFAGSVIGFSGDAITCWFADDDPRLTNPNIIAKLEPASLRATSCALAMQKVIQQQVAIPIPSPEPVALAIKVGVASGLVRRYLVGNPKIQLIPALAGEALVRVSAAEHLADRKEVLVDQPTAAQLGDRVHIAEWRVAKDGSSADRFAVVNGLSYHVPLSPWPILPSGGFSQAQVRPWVLPPVYARLQAGLGEFLTELRPATALFMCFEGISYEHDPEAGIKLNSYLSWVQEIISNYAGTLIQLTIGDKGSYLYAAFGAPVAHEDDPCRAVCAAQVLRTPPDRCAYIKPVRIGISQGTMRTGAYGGRSRRTYGVLGDQVNVAARLMQYAAPGEIIVNKNVQQVVAEQFNWESLPTIQVKGISTLVEVYRLVGQTFIRSPGLKQVGVLVGRQGEIARLQLAIDRAAKGERCVLFIEGQAGIGKSRIAIELIRLGLERGFSVFQGAGQSIEQLTPYRAWRDIFRVFFEQDGLCVSPSQVPGQNPGLDEPRLREFVRVLAPDLLDQIPLLNDILGLGLPETEQTRSLDPAQRQQDLINFLRNLLIARARDKPLLIILEDAQWLDSLSWIFAQYLIKAAEPVGTRPSILFTLVLRPLDEDSLAQEYVRVLQTAPASETLTIQSLSNDECVAVASGRLGVPADRLPSPIVDLIQERSEGNPFFAEQIILSLKEQGLVEVEADTISSRCVIKGNLENARQTLPTTMQGLILARIDRLPLESQLVLKVAAVIGRIFPYNPLSYTLKQHTSISDPVIEGYLNELDARELTSLHIPEPDLTYIFKHLMIQDTAYQTMSFAQRRQLHQDIARWFESVYSADLVPVYGLLAYHWSRAEDAQKASHYLLLAGDEARRVYALPEAIEFYKQALAFLKRSTEYEQTARAQMKLGLTYHLAFDYLDARQAYEEGFALWQQAGAAHPGASLPAVEQPLHADWPYMPVSLDPGMAGDIDTVGVVDQLFCGLVALESGLDITPDLASSWEILDEGRKYVFRLRQDVCWSDAKPVTAADFEFAWKRLLNPAIESPVARTLYDVKGARAYHQGLNNNPDCVAVHAEDEYTLVVELEQPTSYFLYLMAFCASYPVPRHVVQAHGETWTHPENLVTNGAFCLESWLQTSDQEGVISLVRNPGYHGRFSGNLQRVELLARPSEAERLREYEAGNLEMLSFRNLSGDRDRLRQQHASEYLSVPFLATTYLVFDSTRPPFDDLRLRRAFVMAMDRERHADVNLKGFSFPATGGFLPPGMPGYSAEIGLPFDPQRARSLLKETGYGSVESFPNVEFLAGPDQQTITAYLAAQWQEHLGLNIEGQILGWEPFLDRLDHNPPHIFLNIWVNDYPDPDNFLRASETLRWSRWQDPAYQELVESARRINDQTKRLEMYRQADRILTEAAVIVPFNYWRSHMLIKPWVKKYPTSPIKWWYFKDVVMQVE
jgi:adenylate cyclase